MEFSDRPAEDVTASLALGWHMQALYLAKLAPQAGNPQSPRGALPTLANWTSLSNLERARVSLATVCADLGTLPANAERDRLWRAVEARLETACEPKRANLNQAIQELHLCLIVQLTARGDPIGKGYRLGFAMAETALLPLRREAEDLVDLLGEFRLATIKGWLIELKSYLPDHASDATQESLDRWRSWLIDPHAGGDVEWDLVEDRERVTRALRRQGEDWRALLTGQKRAVDLLSAANYVDAAGDMVHQIGRLTGKALRSPAGVALLVFLAAMVGAFVLVAALGLGGAVTGAGIALFGAFGVTAAGVGAAVQKAMKPVQTALWNADVTAAVGRAATRLPQDRAASLHKLVASKRSPVGATPSRSQDAGSPSDVQDHSGKTEPTQ